MAVPKLSPLMQQYLRIKDEHKDCILMFRLGDFYEMFFDDAKEASNVLGLVLTGRDCGLHERAPMCGVPYHSVDTYISKLINSGYKVAVCEQLTDPKLSKGLVERAVIRIITPGTVIEESMLDDKTNNYIASVYIQNGSIGLAYADVSTGDFFTSEFIGSKSGADLLNELTRIEPREVVVNNSSDLIVDRLKTMYFVQETSEKNFSRNSAVNSLLKHFNVMNLSSFGYETSGDFGINAAGALITYLEDTQKNALSHIKRMKRVSISNYMQLDSTTRASLEIVRPIRFDGKRSATLLHLMDKTKTAMGARLLRSWVDQPLIDKNDIESRLDAVEMLKNNPILLESISEALSSVFDIERLCSKIAYSAINPKECLAMARSLKVLPRIHVLLAQADCAFLRKITNDFDPLDDIYALLSNALCDDPPIGIKDGGILRDGFNEEVDKYKNAASGSKAWLAKLEADEREKTGIKTLKIKYNRVFGYYFEVTNSFKHLVPEYFERRQTISNAERYTSKELKELEDVILSADVKRVALEYDLFLEIRKQLYECLERIKLTANCVAQIDAIYSLAKLALNNNYCRPSINSEGRIEILDGRHPVVEENSDELFVPNNATMNNDADRVLIITGPNMAGKSTYMRQIALCVIMAHIGSFVPARTADICIVDKIFARIGASDSLATGQSTFMVEMTEVASILNNATENSLVIFDEIGRGTSTYDGLSIAWSVLEYVVDKTMCGAKALFATHYHELSELEGRLDGVVNYRVAVKEYGDTIVFLRKIVRGSADKSFGIQVAKLAGLPQQVLDRAKEILSGLEDADVNTRDDIVLPVAENRQGNSDPLSAVIARLRKVSPETLTPIESMILLDELCRIVNGEAKCDED